MKTKFFINTIILIIFFILQSTLLEYIKILDIKPDIMLIFVVSAALINGENDGALYGLICGIMQDCIFAPFFGIYTFLYAAIGFAAGIVCKNFYKENLIIAIAAVFFASILFNFLCYVIFALLKGNTDILYFAKTIFLSAAIYNCVAALPVYAIVYYFNEYIITDTMYGRRIF